MELTAKIEEDIKNALKEHDTLKISVLRLLKSVIQNREIELRAKLSLSDVIEVIRHQVKIRKEAIEQYAKAQRPDLQTKEKAELAILKDYSPPEMTKEEITKDVHEVISKVGAKGLADQGKVMQVLAARLKSKTDLGQVARIAREQLLHLER